MHAAVCSPVDDPYFPAAQFEHAVAFASAYWPAAQSPVQAAVCKLAVDPYLPAAQSEHEVEPAMANCPAAHAPVHPDVVSPDDDP